MLTALSWLPRVALLVLIIVLPLCITFLAPSALLPLVVLYLPPLCFAILVYKYSMKNKSIDQDMLIRIFLGGFLPGILIAMVVEMFLMVVGGVLFMAIDNDDMFGQMRQYHEFHPNATSTEFLSHVHIRHSLSVFLGLLFMSFVMAGTVEEYVKYWIVKGKCCIASGLCIPNLSIREVDPYFTILCFAAAGCGFATMENITYTFVSPTLEMQLWTAFARDFLATPLHMVCASMTGMHLVAGEVHAQPSNVWSALAPAITLHGVFDFQAFMFAFWFTDADILSICASILCLVVGILYLNYLRGQINWEYRILVRDELDDSLQIV